MTILSYVDNDLSEDEEYLSMSMMGAMMTALPTFLSSSEENKDRFMEHVVMYHEDIFEPFLNLQLKDK